MGLALTSGTFLTSAAAQTGNQLMEAHLDAKMRRTAGRPLVLGPESPGGVSKATAQIFAATCSTAGFGVLALHANLATVAIAASTQAIYLAAYTPMKTRSPYNTHVGAVAGSLPTLLGFSAVLGGSAATSLTSLLAWPWAPHALWIFGMQTLWQMPHFYALAWLHRVDYKSAGYKMFPAEDPTGHATAKMCKPYLAALAMAPLASCAGGLTSWMFFVDSAVVNALWWKTFVKFESQPGKGTCRHFFLMSLV